MKEYAIYPFKYMKITQNYNQGNHIADWKNSKNYSDMPWDEACKDSGRDYFIPQNDFLVEEVLGQNTDAVTNSVRLKSVNKLYMPYKKEADYLYLTLTHMNEDNLREVKKGQILKKGTMLLMEGTDGNATGNHFHVTANLGKYYGLLQNSNDAWCFTYETSLIPEEAFYVDKSFTEIINANGSNFKEFPQNLLPIEDLKPEERNEDYDQLEVKVSNLRARETPSLEGLVLGYIKPAIYNYDDKVENEDYTWYKIDKYFIAYNSDWINLYPKEVKIEDTTDNKEDKDSSDDNNYDDTSSNEEEEKETIVELIVSFIKRLFEKLFKL